LVDNGTVLEALLHVELVFGRIAALVITQFIDINRHTKI
jgi:hypothetical protein